MGTILLLSQELQPLPAQDLLPGLAALPIYLELTAFQPALQPGARKIGPKLRDHLINAPAKGLGRQYRFTL